MQYGSYPVVAPQNETFPADFNLHRTGLQPIHLAPNNNSRLLKMSSPIPGSWFTIAFINDYLEDSISQKVGIFSCRTGCFLLRASDTVDLRY